VQNFFTKFWEAQRSRPEERLKVVKKTLMFNRRQFNDRLQRSVVLSSLLEDIEMRINLKALALSSLAICATAAFAANQARVDVPFSFTAKGQAYPAGSYSVILDSNDQSVTFQSRVDDTKHITWTVGPTDPANYAAVVKFDRVGEDYSLKTIQMNDRITPNLDTRRKGGVSATTSIGGN
jgi:hypothetical protein